jgi:hypothetical protein
MIKYVVIAVNAERNERTVVSIYDTRKEAEDVIAQESFWIDQGEYDGEEEDTVLSIEEVSLPDPEES